MILEFVGTVERRLDLNPAEFSALSHEQTKQEIHRLLADNGIDWNPFDIELAAIKLGESGGR